MLDIDPEVIYDKLFIDPKAKPVMQKKRNLNEEKLKIVVEEAMKLVKAREKSSTPLGSSISL